MFKLNEAENNELNFEGISLKIDLSFDNVFDVFELFENEKDDVIRLYGALRLLVDKDIEEILTPEKAGELLGIIIDNYINVKKEDPVRLDLNGNPVKKRKGTAKEEDDSDPVVSFSYDADYIWTSFFTAYHIDLHQEFGRLSYQKFMLLFRDLPEDTKIKRIIEIRTWQPEKGTSSKEKERMRKLQNEYRLPDDI
ncbi:hypothetical protein ESZ50_08035 [Weissella muntiaci]|uniref:Bacteriophage Gp15 protein n=1 Tax=Weissella muntiaci TaxID=2508881 RepID=A0A6C2C4I3_9LACO|nr:Gp15 family bacteriophage protein [Weissella muntiaci]TYC48818.1 hypothetical protein ESZ50_08035 [Weissella muntiaci]